MKKMMEINVAPKNDFQFYLTNAYPTVVRMRAELLNEGKKAEAAVLWQYANKLQRIGYTAKKAENKDLVLGYTKDMRLICNDANRVYAQA